MATLNWCYGAKEPDVACAVDQAIELAHKYRNRLCELELEKRKRHYDILRRLAPGFVHAELDCEGLEAELGDVRKSIQLERSRQATKHPTGVKHLVDRTSEIKLSLKIARERLKTEKKAAYTDPNVIQAMDENTAQHKDECKLAKEDSGLYWGTEAIVNQACRSFSSGSPPKFKRYSGEGQLAVQLQGGLDCDDASKSNTLFYIGDEIDHKRRECFIRIGSDNGRPVFAKLAIVFHRPLPKGKIKWAYLEKRRIATTVKWIIRITIDVDEPAADPLPGEVAIHTGWRMEDNGLRVATWLGSDGKSGVLKLPPSHYEDYARLDKIKSDRDSAMNSIRESLAEWMNDRDIPEWMDEARKHIRFWRSANRFDGLYWQWLASRIDGDSDILDALNQWRKKDKHAWQHERRLSVRIVRRRKDMFRCFVKGLSSAYGIAIVSPIDAKELVENSDPEDLERDLTQAHRHAKWAAVSDLTNMIREKFRTRCVEVDCSNITRQCANCGQINEAPRRKVQCSGCCVTYDRDDNAVANTMARGEVAIKGGALLALEKANENKEIAAKEKLLKMQEARRQKASRQKEISSG